MKRWSSQAVRFAPLSLCGLLALTACAGGEVDAAPGVATGGASGAAGSAAGVSGASGQAGGAGTSAGSAGAAGTAGVSGASGQGGAAGATAGAAGTSGAAGASAGGASGASGSGAGGATAGGSSGTSGAAGTGEPTAGGAAGTSGAAGSTAGNEGAGAGGEAGTAGTGGTDAGNGGAGGAEAGAGGADAGSGGADAGSGGAGTGGTEAGGGGASEGGASGEAGSSGSSGQGGASAGSGQGGVSGDSGQGGAGQGGVAQGGAGGSLVGGAAGAGGATGQVTVTSSADAGLSATPLGAFAITPGSAQVFTVTPKSGSALSPLVDGTCPAGTWAGTVYTTPAISESCTVHFRSVVPVLQPPPDWKTTSTLNSPLTTMALVKPAGPTDSVSFDLTAVEASYFHKFTAQATATSDQVVQLSWERTPTVEYGGPVQVTFFADGPEGRTAVTAYEDRLAKDEHPGGTVTLTLRAGHAFGVYLFDGSHSTQSWSIKTTTLATTPSLHVAASAPPGVTLSSKGATVAGGARPGFVVTAPDGVVLPAIPGGTCPPGSWDGKRYTAGAITGDCTIDFSTAGSPGPGDSGGGTTTGDQPNQPPTLVLGSNLALDTDPRFYTSLTWARLSPGPASEASQHLTAQLAVTGTTGTLTFDTVPTLDVATGNLSFAPTLGTFGTATVELTLKDDGGTANGGVDTTKKTFTIQVNSPAKARDLSINGFWRSLCVAITLIGDDVDVHQVSADDGDHLFWKFDSLPKNGFLTEFVGVAVSDSEGWQPLFGSIGDGYSRATSMCYIPFSETFTGLDSFTYLVKDSHGGPPSKGTVNIEIVKN